MWRHGLFQQVITEEERINLEAASSKCIFSTVDVTLNRTKASGNSETRSALLSDLVT